MRRRTASFSEVFGNRTAARDGSVRRSPSRHPLDTCARVATICRVQETPEESPRERVRQEDLDVARACGAAGARSMTKRGDVIQGAAEQTADSFVSAVLSGNLPKDLRAWARTVGRNAARKLLARRSAVSLERLEPVAREEVDEGAEGFDSRSFLTRVVALLDDSRVRLTEREREVLGQIDPGEALKANARRIGMKSFVLRRMLRSVRRRALATWSPSRRR